MDTKIEWSRTRRDLFLKCPRAWYLRYGYPSSRVGINEFQTSQRPWDLMLRAMKEILVERLEDLREGKKWSPLLLEHQLKYSLQKQIQQASHDIKKRYFEALLRYAKHRFTLLWRCRIIRRLEQRKYPCWYVLDRTESVSIGTQRIYASPDLAVLIQNRWHLVRFDMQGSPQKVSDEFEANAMVLWAKHHGGYPQCESSYRLLTIGWRRGFWHTQTFQPTPQSVKQCYKLLEYDCKAMLEIHQYSYTNLALLPLAKSKKTCDSCSFRARCPGGENLVIARYEQTMLELAQQSASSQA
tara:strand:- start:489 stop:1379 length:891 start_codon:yes stop_codon:yes gene_type:complete